MQEVDKNIFYIWYNIMNVLENPTHLELLDYYIHSNEKEEKLKEWGNIPRKLRFNIEFPFSHASGVTRLLVRLWIAKYDGNIFIYISGYWREHINDAIRLWFLNHLKAHHRTRDHVDKILNEAFTNEWIKTVETEEDIQKIAIQVTEKISEICDSYK